MDCVRGVAVLGSTGSVGQCAVDVVKAMGDRYRVALLMARANDDVMLSQISRTLADSVVLTDARARDRLKDGVRRRSLRSIVAEDSDAVGAMIEDEAVTDVIVALPGIVGLPYTLCALSSGKRVLLANKESLVVGGRLIMDALRSSCGELIPIDSEHNALHQLLGGSRVGGPFPENVRSIILTASGGPFRQHAADDLGAVTPEQACDHPVWSMGRKISVDSATLMNKGLEVIEAYWLFKAPVDRIRVVIHPQSIVHAIVEYIDGNSVAHMGVPDMRLPIATALAHPERIGNDLAAPDWGTLSPLTFEEPRTDAFPCLDLAYESLRIGGGAPAALNAANEIAVQRFLDGEIAFTDIPRIVERALRDCDCDDGSYEALMATDSNARKFAMEMNPA